MSKLGQFISKLTRDEWVVWVVGICAIIGLSIRW